MPRCLGGRSAHTVDLFRAVFDASPHALLLERAGVVAYANSAGARLFGQATPDALVGRPVSKLATTLFSPATYEIVRQEFRYNSETLSACWVRDPSECRRLREQLVEAQRMEALGRLVGGISHDFKNLLTAIVLFADLLGSELREDGPSQHYVNEIRAAAHRGAELIGQMLAFASRQPLLPRPIDVGAVVSGMGAMLRPLLGPRIELVVRRSSKAALVKADVVAIEQVVMNLAINARDAMPGGGRLRISSATVRIKSDDTPQCEIVGARLSPGEYVRIRVEDSGVGMDEATRKHALEPFFSTKKDQGAGLGLTTVGAMVTRSGGSLAIESAPRKGTRVTIWLPCIGSEPAIKASGRKNDDGRIPRGSETILLVEGNTAVRTATAAMLSACGYRVKAARDAKGAMRLARSAGAQLLLTEALLPGPDNGQELARRIRKLCPQMRVLYLAGRDGCHGDETAATDSEVLVKPFSKAVLARRVRQSLENGAGKGLSAHA